MARIVSIANQKGGVGKTTTAVNLGASLAAAEKRVLVVDIDPQGNASSGLGYPPGSLAESVYNVLLDGRPVTELMKATALPFLHVLPAHRDLVGAELELADLPDREQRLRQALAAVANDFDFILIDSPPSLGLLTLNALVAAEAVLIPMQCEYYAMEGISELTATLERVKRALNPELEVEGVLLTMVDERTNLTQQVIAEVRSHFKDKDITELTKTYGAVATELVTGREVWLREGSVIDSVRASAALPGLFTPAQQGERLLEGVDFERKEIRRDDVAKLAGLKRKNAEANFAGILAGLAEGPEAEGGQGSASDFCQHPGILS